MGLPGCVQFTPISQLVLEDRGQTQNYLRHIRSSSCFDGQLLCGCEIGQVRV